PYPRRQEVELDCYGRRSGVLASAQRDDRWARSLRLQRRRGRPRSGTARDNSEPDGGGPDVAEPHEGALVRRACDRGFELRLGGFELLGVVIQRRDLRRERGPIGTGRAALRSFEPAPAEFMRTEFAQNSGRDRQHRTGRYEMRAYKRLGKEGFTLVEL